MKNNTIAIFLATYFLFLMAHAGINGTPAVGQNAGKADVQAVYELEPVSVTRSVLSEDKKAVELAACDYQMFTLTVTNLDALTSAEAETAAQNMEAFNSRMAALMEGTGEQDFDVGDAAKEAYADGFWIVAYYDDVVSYGAIEGEIVSVWSYRSCYTGGAHPNSYVSSYLFDLAAGQFIPDPSQLADDPAAFHAGAAEKLIEKADGWEDGSWGYWDDYQDIIRSGSGGVAHFDDTGLTVDYAPYELGCYAIGTVSLHLDWEELEPLLGPGGMARLGR